MILSTKETIISPRAESVVSAQLYIYAHRRFSAASAFDLQRIEKTKTERFTEFICLFFIWINAERFTESLKHKWNDLQESAQVERFTAHQRIEKIRADRFTEFIGLSFIWLNADRFTESLKHKRNDLQEPAQALELPLANGKK